MPFLWSRLITPLGRQGVYLYLTPKCSLEKGICWYSFTLVRIESKILRYWHGLERPMQKANWWATRWPCPTFLIIVFKFAPALHSLETLNPLLMINIDYCTWLTLLVAGPATGVKESWNSTSANKSSKALGPCATRSSFPATVAICPAIKPLVKSRSQTNWHKIFKSEWHQYSHSQRVNDNSRLLIFKLKGGQTMVVMLESMRIFSYRRNLPRISVHIEAVRAQWKKIERDH